MCPAGDLILRLGLPVYPRLASGSHSCLSLLRSRDYKCVPPGQVWVPSQLCRVASRRATAPLSAFAFNGGASEGSTVGERNAEAKEGLLPTQHNTFSSQTWLLRAPTGSGCRGRGAVPGCEMQKEPWPRPSGNSTLGWAEVRNSTGGNEDLRRRDLDWASLMGCCQGEHPAGHRERVGGDTAASG